MSEIEGDLKRIKICLLGSEKVGKTLLAHKLVDLDYAQNRVVAECQKFIKQLSEKKQILIYYDFPPINATLIEQLTHDHIFDVMVCLFKDSASFGQLYEFFESISKKTEENNRNFNEYWESIRNIILVYSDFEDKCQVQLEELFNILSEQIRNFNRTASIKQFVLKHQLSNHQYLRQLIEKNRFQEHQSDDLIPSQREITNNPSKVSQTVEETTSIHDLDVLQQSPKKENSDARGEDQDEQIPELTQIKLTSTKEKLLNSEESIEQADNIQTLGKQRNHSSEIEVNSYKGEQLLKADNEEGNKVQAAQACKKQGSREVLAAGQIAEKQVTDEQEKEKEHFREVFNKLMEKINKQQIAQSKKASYVDLFEEFRRTSKNESKISKELRQYWQQKIEKLEEEDDDEQEQNVGDQDELEDIEPSKQVKHHPRSTENQTRNKKHGEPLKPQSNYLDDRKPRRQKSTSASNSCFCEIM